MNPVPARLPFVFGLDLGAESVGWAILPFRDGQVVGILAAGAHCFEAGVEGDLESGRDQSRAKARRDARLPRRQHWRRAWRLRKVLRLLQRHGLLPAGSIRSPQQVHEFLLALDASLRAKWDSPGDRITAHLLPYRLRAKALTQRLEPYELGRALYHLAQRRGFASNRKAAKDKEDEGKVKAGITELAKKMAEAGAPTLGAYFATLDPEQERIRRRWTSRQMYKDEFEAIWAKQAEFHPDVFTDVFKERLHEAIFFQRPLKSQKHLIGHCELMPRYKRAPAALRVAQRFRLLQKVNDLEVDPPGERPRALTREERDKLISALDTQGDLTFAKIRGKKYLGLPKGTTFNLQEGGEKKLPGNRTDAKLRKVFSNRWDELSEPQRDQVVEDVLTFEKSDALARRAEKAWGLDPEAARELAELTFEEDHARHCRKALHVLVRRMEDGLSYMTARKDEFPDSFTTREVLDELPPLNKAEAIAELRNPAVCRALTELRKLVNAIVRRYGKPEFIRIELARDLKRPRKQREEASKRNRQNQKRRDDAKKKILHELGITDPKGWDVLKVILAEECDWTCPYTGRSIGMRDLIGDSPQFDIEHIWPMSQSLDNGYFNKTLCYHEENRDRKRNRTPFEAYSGDPKRWDEILARVRRFQGDAARAKLRRFEAEEIPDDFTARQLQDTRYASRLAADYLGLFYGGRIDAGGTRRIQVSAGGLTAHLRNEWMLNAILNDGGTKTRDDHRHHAVDAIAIGLADAAAVKKLADAAKRAADLGRKLFAPIPLPWETFLDDARQAVNAIRVSRRVSRKLSGPLHAESFYSDPIPVPGGSKDRHIRKELHKLTATEISSDRIVDPIVRELVQARHRELGGGVPAKVFSDPASHPALTSRDGRKIPIHKVRIKARVNPWTIGEKPHQRHVTSKPGSNHHIVIVALLGANGRERKWEDKPVSRFEVNQRLLEASRQGRKPHIIQRDWGPGYLFKFSLVQNDYVIMEDDDGEEQLYRVASISEGDIEFRHHCDARTIDQLKKAKARIRASGDKMRKRKARKVRVTYLGEVLSAND